MTTHYLLCIYVRVSYVRHAQFCISAIDMIGKIRQKWWFELANALTHVFPWVCVGAHRSICRSFLFPTSIIGTLHRRKSKHHVVINALMYDTRHRTWAGDMRAGDTHWTFPTMSNSFSWITCTTSKLEETRGHFLLQFLAPLISSPLTLLSWRRLQVYLLLDVTE